MAWEQRDGRAYYYRSRRLGGRVVKEYVGAGPGAELAAQLDEEERRERDLKKAEWEEEASRMRAIEAPVEELCEVAEVLARATLMAAGYRQHNRGEWRLRRGGKRK